MNFLIETYGCQMNIAESDSLSRLLILRGHLEAQNPEEADVVILNTCSVRLTAEERIDGRVGFYRGLAKKIGKEVPVVLMGCMAQNVGDELQKKFPDVVKLVWGTYHKDGIADFLSSMDGSSHIEMQDYEFLPAEKQRNSDFKAFLPISHGCNNFCTYCIVPYVRGREVHRSFSEISDEVKRLLDDGVAEITLLGQNVNSYKDENRRFPELLSACADLGVARLSFLTSHPKDFSRELVDAMKSHENILRYLHLPFQAGSNEILKHMNRKYSREDYLKKIETAKEIPGLSLSTDIMVGFPNETEEDFEDTMNIVESVRFLEAYMYRYNIRPGTKAETMNPQVDEEIKLSRLSRLIARQNEISKEIRQSKIGLETTALLESISKKDSSVLSGRTHEGLMVFVKGSENEIGKIIKVKLIETRGTGFSAERI